MSWTDEMQQFVSSHLADDTARLLLSAHRFPTIDVPFAVEQIEARRRLRYKLPAWYQAPALIMSGRVPAEQCSSEQTARFKRSVMLPDARSLCDMTGGMGVDFWYMSQRLDLAIYTERHAALCDAARHNFSVLSSLSSSSAADAPRQVVVRHGLSTELPVPDVDVIYLDPARRSSDGGRVYEISDCEPDVIAWHPDLLRHCRQLIVKVSPMADITRAVSRLRHVSDVYVVAVRGECKELLLVLAPSAPAEVRDYHIHCVDFLSSRTLSFSLSSAELSPVPVSSLAVSLGRYFYEPDVTLLKCQAFAALAGRFAVRMLDADCHYFTSDALIPDFPGRVFQVHSTVEFSSRTLRRLRSVLPQANIATRAFPLTANQVRQRTGIRDGGDAYLFGATLHGVGPLFIRCHKLGPL